MSNVNDKKYGVIHELGDYSQFKELNEENNKILNEQVRKQNKDTKKDKAVIEE